MPNWICCNSCFHPPAADLTLAVSTCGHIICCTCFQKGKQGECLICKAECQITPLSDKSSSEVKALFSDISTVATKYFSEISKVLLFQARHQRRLTAHYQKKNGKLEEVLNKMNQEIQQMNQKITEQKAYIAKLENTLQHLSTRTALQSNQSISFSCPSKPTLTGKQIPFASPRDVLRNFSSNCLVTQMEVEPQGLYKKPEIFGSVPRLSLISPPQDGRIGTVPRRSASQSSLGSFSARSATVSRDKAYELPGHTHHAPPTQSPTLPYRSNAAPGFKSPAVFHRSSTLPLATTHPLSASRLLLK